MTNEEMRKVVDDSFKQTQKIMKLVDQVTSENDRLKEINKGLLDVQFNLRAEIYEYREALSEIANEVDSDGSTVKIAERILEIATEALNKQAHSAQVDS